jgi:cell division septum initiation protein DivIVA
VAYNPHLTPHTAGDLDPEAIAVRVFAESRRGYEPTEVQAYLQVVAEEFRSAHQREHELRLHIADLERQLYDTEERAMAAEARAHETATAAPVPAVGSSTGTANLSLLDETQLTVLVGEETAKVLGAARGAASEIRANAERTAAEMHRKAAAAAEQVAARAEAAIEEREREADAEAVRRLDETDAAIGLAQAEATDQLARLRSEADSVAAATVADARQHLDEARSDASRLLDQAHHEAEQRRAQADADAAEVVTRAHDTGRQLVGEAQQMRARLLEDLLRRRKLLRRQVEQLHAGRERFLAAFDVARDAMAGIDDELARSLPEARAAAEHAGRRADETPDGPTAELEAMIEAGRPDGSVGAPVDGPGGEGAEPAASVFTRLRGDRPEPDPAPETSDDPGRRPVPHLVVVPPPAPTADEPVVEAPIAEATSGGDAPVDPARAEPALIDAGPEPDQLDELVVDDPADPVLDGPEPDIDPLLTRDALLDELTRPVVRLMKRALTDEQNDVLDAVRRRRPLPSLDELLSPYAEHERRYAEATVTGLAKAAAAGRELPGVLRDPTDSSTGGSAAKATDLASVTDLAATLAVDVVGSLRVTLDECLSGADLLRATSTGRSPGARGPTKAAVTAQADEIADQVRLAYREARNRRVDAAATIAVSASFARGVQAAEPGELTERLLDGLPTPQLAD